MTKGVKLAYSSLMPQTTRRTTAKGQAIRALNLKGSSREGGSGCSARCDARVSHRAAPAKLFKKGWRPKLLRRPCGASSGQKSIARAWLRNARQSLPCPARQSAVNGRNRVRRSTRPRAETAQGPAACGVKPKHPCGVFRFHAAPFFNCYKERSNNPGNDTGAAPFSNLPPARRRFFGLSLQSPMPRPKDIQAIYATSPNSCIVALGGSYKACGPSKTLCLVCTEDPIQHVVKRQWVEYQNIFASTAVDWWDLSPIVRLHIVGDMANWARNSAYGKPTH